MSLNDIRNKLYDKNKEEETLEAESENKDALKQIEGTIFADDAKTKTQDLWEQQEMEGLGESGKKALKIGGIILGIILLFVIAVTTFFLIRKSMFSSGKVSMEIMGSEKVQSGTLVNYEISYSNNNWGDLKGAVLRVSYPENFKPENNLNFTADTPTEGIFNIGDIAGNTEGKIVFSGKAFNPKGALMYLKANLSYLPSNSSTRLALDSQKAVSVSATPILLEIQAPQNLASGDAIDYQIKYKNTGTETVENLSVKIDYPTQFIFSESTPKNSQNENIWNVGTVSSGQEGKIVVSGKLEGEKDNMKTAKVFAGTLEGDKFISYNEEKVNTKIIISPLSISQSVNNTSDLVFNAGDLLTFKLNYKNNSNIGMRDVIITEKIDSPILDYTTLKVEGGNFDVDTKTITWKSAGVGNLKNLEASKGGEIVFSVRIKNIFPITSETDKNFVISTVAKIDSPDIVTPIASNKIISGNKLDIKINSKLVLNVGGFYADSNISNSGPVPPRVGEETTYTMHWRVLNIFNDISDAKVSAIIPASAEMTGKIFPEDARVEYNSRDNSISWNIGNVPAGTGVTKDPLEVSFQVKIKPSPDKVNKLVDLLGESTLSAKDLFTGKSLEVLANKKNTDLKEDKTIAGKDKVVK